MLQRDICCHKITADWLDWCIYLLYNLTLWRECCYWKIEWLKKTYFRLLLNAIVVGTRMVRQKIKQNCPCICVTLSNSYNCLPFVSLFLPFFTDALFFWNIPVLIWKLSWSRLALLFSNFKLGFYVAIL